jgi:hypothetical protein
VKEDGSQEAKRKEKKDGMAVARTHRGGVQPGSASRRQVRAYSMHGHNAAEVGSQATAPGDIDTAPPSAKPVN